MSILDQLSGMLNQYAPGSTPDPEKATEHFQQVATQVPQNQLGGMLSDIFGSRETGSFGDNISQMFGQSNPDQKAGILNQMLARLGPGMLSGFLPGVGNQVSPEQAQQVSPEHVKSMADHAQQQDPGVVQMASDFYSQHPQLVQALGAGVAAWALSRFQRR